MLTLLANIYVPCRLFIENYIINFADNKDISKINDNLYIGNISTATNRELLQREGITHIIDILSHKFEPFTEDFEYLHIAAHDSPDCDLTYNLPVTNMFIRNAIKKGGKVFVHCMGGVSRSVSIVLAYMMTTSDEHINAILNEIKEVRPIAQPNTGFMKQLVTFKENVNSMDKVRAKHYEDARPPPINPYFTVSYILDEIENDVFI